MPDLDEDEKRFLVSLLAQSLWLKPLNPSGGEGRVVTSAGDPVAHEKTAYGLQRDGLVGWLPFTTPYGQQQEPVQISLTESGRIEAERLRAEPMSDL